MNTIPDMTLSDESVVAQVLGGDTAAFSVLVERYGRRVFRVCMAVTKDADAADDCYQKTFLLALERLGQFRSEAKFSTWLTRIALNVSVGHLRRGSRRLETSDGGEHALNLVDPQENPEAACMRAQLRKAIEQALPALSPRLRMVLILRDLEEVSTEETARILGIKVAAVKTRLLRARLKMREALAPFLTGSRAGQPARRFAGSPETPQHIPWQYRGNATAQAALSM